jgi:hypothetical protein
VGKQGLRCLVGFLIPRSLGEHGTYQDLEGSLPGVPVPGVGAVGCGQDLQKSFGAIVSHVQFGRGIRLKGSSQ